MKTLDRRRKLKTLVQDNDYLSVDELCERLDASPATIRRDLTYMETHGEIERFRGGAKAVSDNKGLKKALDLDKRLEEKKSSKRKISRIAAETIQDNEYVYIDTSSTTYFIPEYITAKNVVIVTNAVLLVEKLWRLGIETYVLNGYIDEESGSIVAEDTIEKIDTLNFSKCFLGAYGIDSESGFTTYGTVEGEMKKKLIANSKETFILADSTKFGVNAFYTFSTLEQAKIITDKAPEEIKRKTKVIEIEEE
ncbi:DeoR/GlpR family DNA-binding transcription regulator [Enterococcus sp. DIV0187]|uniref:DeoR/GlpR family DNA-binding transcription regulator n=1 Tax=Enterococcus sp. DIV0187 TaxID=2774644 RepID=UPI003F20C772